MDIHKHLRTVAAAAGFCLALLPAACAGEGAAPPAPGDGDFVRPGPAAAAPGQPGRDGAERPWNSRGRSDPRSRRPEGGLPLLGDVKGMKEELDKHRANMKALQDQMAEVLGKPGEERGKGGADPAEDQERTEALKNKVDQVAPAIVAEFIRHYQAVSELLKADQEGATAKLKEHMMKPPTGLRRPSGGPGDAPPPPEKPGDETQPRDGGAGHSHGRPGGK
ncbi:MAG TPA: hypothetical protein PK280_16975 [Planctomycetota bacterium]|nr:hypothetical protein [Planctomycetota bacterium]